MNLNTKFFKLKKLYVTNIYNKTHHFIGFVYKFYMTSDASSRSKYIFDEVSML